ALRRHAGVLHGERALRRRHRELPDAGESFRGRAVVGRPGRRHRETDHQQGLHHRARHARPRRHAQRRDRQTAPARTRLLRADAAVEHRSQQRPAMELELGFGIWDLGFGIWEGVRSSMSQSVRLTFVVAIAALTPVLTHAQLFTLTKDQMIEYTAQNPFERFPDGRPKVPDELIERARGMSSEGVLASLPAKRVPNQYE